MQLEDAPSPPLEYISLPGVYANFHGSPVDRAALDAISAHAATAIPEIAARLGVPAGRPMNIYLADDDLAFREMQPGLPPSWADGTAWPHRSLIYLRSPRLRPGTARPMEQVLDHEIAHVLLGQAFGHRPVPTWLQEGLAQWIAGEVSPDLPKRLAKGVLGRLFTLDELTAGFPADQVRANLAYAQSADLIAFVANQYGEDAITVLVQEMAKGRHVNASFRAATGESAEEVDARWRGRLEGSNLWLASFSDDAFWWGLGAPLVLGAWFAVRRKNRVTLDRWEREERLREELFARWMSNWSQRETPSG